MYLSSIGNIANVVKNKTVKSLYIVNKPSTGKRPWLSVFFSFVFHFKRHGCKTE